MEAIIALFTLTHIWDLCGADGGTPVEDFMEEPRKAWEAASDKDKSSFQEEGALGKNMGTRERPGDMFGEH